MLYHFTRRRLVIYKGGTTYSKSGTRVSNVPFCLGMRRKGEDAMHLDRISAEICFELTITSNVVNLSRAGLYSALDVGLARLNEPLINLIRLTRYSSAMFPRKSDETCFLPIRTYAFLVKFYTKFYSRTRGCVFGNCIRSWRVSRDSKRVCKHDRIDLPTARVERASNFVSLEGWQRTKRRICAISFGDAE